MAQLPGIWKLLERQIAELHLTPTDSKALEKAQCVINVTRHPISDDAENIIVEMNHGGE